MVRENVPNWLNYIVELERVAPICILGNLAYPHFPIKWNN